MIVSGAYGDVNGDGVPDYVYLTADAAAEQGSPFLQNITVNVQCGATRQVYAVPLDPNANAGYQPTVFLGDFTKDGIRDILVTIDSGGSGALTYNYIFSFVSNQARKLFDFQAYNEHNRYSVQYMDGYKVKVTSPATKTEYLVDISGRGADYLSQLYDANGKLLQPVQGNANGVSGFYPVDMERDGVYEIQAYQRITGLYNADSLGYVINTLQWNGSRFGIWQQWLAISGNPAG
ncbi:VCBS repeat-containing protein [Paenibacillus sp. TRM 82003]|nr:VCBS repeat-containing protein [Paenibacillus sp. TRM 82003]